MPEPTRNPRSPRRVSPRVFLYDAGTPLPAVAPGALALAEIRSSAFGDGSHPTTRLCAGAVDLLCSQFTHGFSFLDVGTGTGILARIARARGARFTAGTDIDPASLSAARANALLDRASREITFTDASPDHWGPRFDLVVANILECPLRELGPALVAALTDGGSLLISGFTRLQVPSLSTYFAALGLREARAFYREDWAGLTLSQRMR